MNVRLGLKPPTPKSWLVGIFLLCFYPLLSSQEIRGEETAVTLLLFTGEIHLLDGEHKKTTPVVGQRIPLSKVSEIVLEENSRAFLLKEKQLVELKAAGTYQIETVFETKGTFLERSLTFLEEMVTPRSFISRTLVRGEKELEEANEQDWFEDKWLKIAMEDSERKSQFSVQDLLAMAAWYQQQQEPARVAYILERLHLSISTEHPFYRQLRIEALNTVTFSEISREVESARDRQQDHVKLGRHKALLIGIDRYRDPAWQELKTPVRDINELKQVLVNDYQFAEKDILLLENATYEQMIEAFQQLKSTGQENSSLLIYYAGHGFYPPDEEEGYWVPSDGGSPKTQRLFLSTSTILSKIKAIDSRHTLVIADSCFSGSLIRRTRGAEVQSRYFWDLSRKKSRQIITSGGLEPVSDKGWGDNSIFAGKLIDLLKQRREEPLSASELALNLRKEIKESSFEQTPEYGRLYTADDENGEFFFIRRNQQLVPQPPPQSTSLPQRQPEVLPVADQIEDPEVLHEGNRLIVGGGFLGTSLSYKFLYTDLNGQSQTETSNTTLSGTLFYAGWQHTKDRFSYKLQAEYGNLVQSATECSDQDKASYFCSAYEGASVSGDFNSISGYVVYNVLPRYELDLDLGGGVKYQKYTFSELLYSENIETQFLSICLRADLIYHLQSWFFGGEADFCMRVTKGQGNLDTLASGQLREVHIPLNMHIGLTAGYLFK